jgi:hypothetical protein
MSEAVPTRSQKIRIFPDFWNFQLALNHVAPADYRPDWRTMLLWLISKTRQLLLSDASETLQLEGIHVYMSYNSQTEEDRKLHE